MNKAGVRQLTVRASDGLRLSVEDAGPRTGTDRSPLLCLAGLTRTKRDFYDLRERFAFHPTEPRRVILMDARGRGESDYASEASHYDVRREADDAAQVACALGLHDVVVVGTSRGGILAMVLALTRPGLIAGSVLNDIGPRIAGAGLARLKRQLDGRNMPSSWDEAVVRIKASMGSQFTAFDDDDWERFARLTFAEKDGKPAPCFDAKLLEPLAELPDGLPFIDLSGPFKALVTRPTLVLRGGNSDLLDDATLEDAIALGAEAQSIPGEGHAPSLRSATLDVIATFLEGHSL